MALVVIDTPQGIEYMKRRAILHGLRLEYKFRRMNINPTAAPTRGRALKSAQRLLRDNGIQPRGVRRTVLAQLEDFLGENKS